MSWWESLVQIRRRTDGEKGSGIFISPGEVLTAAHVVTSRTGQPLDVDSLRIDVRFQSFLVAGVRISVLPGWVTSGGAENDVALIQVEPRRDLGVPTIVDVPPASQSAMLEGVGFEAQNDRREVVAGNTRCRPSPAGAPLLFSHAYAPVEGMSGGPLCTARPRGVHIAGIMIRASQSGLVGVSVTAAVLTTLRAALRADT